ncbi:MAG: hypothetical protein M1835_007783 [Candelina submexicana]|nr:MAG: hypothetical protein M1835_007783 [Candelina submexicana]
MASTNVEKVKQFPQKMLSFSCLRSPAKNRLGPRLGRLAPPSSARIETPHYIALTSRGAIPHLSPDLLKEHADIRGVHVALEDFIERALQATPPLYSIPKSTATNTFKQFIALPQAVLLLLAPRRTPPIYCPASNTNTAISILTSVGFRFLESEEYAKATSQLQPDIVVSMGDIVQLGQKSGFKRIDKMGDRTTVWTKELIEALSIEEESRLQIKKPAIFAPILPIEYGQQSYYLEQLRDEMRPNISGLAFYDMSSLAELPSDFSSLPRLSLDEPDSPHKLLYEISLGIDLLTIPFIGAATDAGIALDFSFPSTDFKQNGTPPLPLGIDMWSPVHATDLSPLRPQCKCYTCTRHHRAYLQHLLAAKEMLAWVLLQIHNHHVMDEFFAGVRRSIAGYTFDEDRMRFEAVYERDLPEKTGQGPRVRGYQFRSIGHGEPKRNPLAYKALDEVKEVLVEATLPSPSADAMDLEEHGFAEKVNGK